MRTVFPPSFTSSFCSPAPLALHHTEHFLTKLCFISTLERAISGFNVVCALCWVIRWYIIGGEECSLWWAFINRDWFSVFSPEAFCNATTWWKILFPFFVHTVVYLHAFCWIHVSVDWNFAIIKEVLFYFVHTNGGICTTKRKKILKKMC